MNSQNKIRTVCVNERGQIVIPEDIRKDFGIGENTTLIMIERDGELVIKKETDILSALENGDKFWRILSKNALPRIWSEEDKVWDKIYEAKK